MCLDDIIAAAKAGHSAFSKGKTNGKIYFNVNVWKNDEPDQFDNTHGVTLSSTKEARESGKEKKSIYIGNLKTPKAGGAEEKVPLQEGDKAIESIDDDLDKLPF